MSRSICIYFSGLSSSLDFFLFSEPARAERFFHGIRAAVLCYSLFWLLLLQMFTFLQKKSWFMCIIYLSTKARPKKWFNRSKIIHEITFLKNLPILDAVMLVMWCWSKMKCVYLSCNIPYIRIVKKNRKRKHIPRARDHSRAPALVS